MQTVWRGWSLREKALSLFWLGFAGLIAVLALRESGPLALSDVISVVGLIAIPLSWSLCPAMFFAPLLRAARIATPTSPPALGMVAFAICMSGAFLLRLAGL